MEHLVKIHKKYNHVAIIDLAMAVNIEKYIEENTEENEAIINSYAGKKKRDRTSNNNWQQIKYYINSNIFIKEMEIFYWL